MKIYEVGGAVRDELMGRKCKDRDFVVLGADESLFMKMYPNAHRVGKNKCVYIAGGDEYTISEDADIKDDLEKRDLTINAVAKDETGRFTAHPFAMSDIENRVLRPVREENFISDPLRVYRAARFAASFPGFSVHSSLEHVMKKVSGQNLLAGITAERVGKEVLEAFSAPDPGRFLKLLHATGSLGPWLREFERADDIPAGPFPYHSESLFEHTCQVMKRLAGNTIRVWMAFCHDLGKSETDPDLLPRHYGHDIRGEKMAVALGRRLKMPNRYIQAGAMAARFHMVAGRYDELRPSRKVDLLTSLDQAGLTDDLFALVKADNGDDFSGVARADLGVILKVKLPVEKRGLGEKSGEILRQLRCMLLGNLNR